MSRPILEYEAAHREPPPLPPSLPVLPLITGGPTPSPLNGKLRNATVAALTLAVAGALLFSRAAGDHRVVGLALLLIDLPLAALCILGGLLTLTSTRPSAGNLGSVLLGAVVLLLIVLLLRTDPMFGEMLKYGDH